MEHVASPPKYGAQVKPVSQWRPMRGLFATGPAAGSGILASAHTSQYICVSGLCLRGLPCASRKPAFGCVPLKYISSYPLAKAWPCPVSSCPECKHHRLERVAGRLKRHARASQALRLARAAFEHIQPLFVINGIEHGSDPFDICL